MTYDNFIENNIEFYKKNFLKKNFHDLYDNKITKRTLLFTMLKKSETSLQYFDENKICRVCNSKYIFNPFYKNKALTEDYCSSFSCNQKFRNNTYILKNITLKQANHLVMSLYKNNVVKKDIIKILKRYIIEDKSLLKVPKLSDKLVYIDFIDMWIIDTTNKKVSSMLNKLIKYYNVNIEDIQSDYIIPRYCAHCNIIFNIFTEKQNINKFCSHKCYHLHQNSNPEMFKTENTRKANIKKSLLMKQKIKDGLFTPCITNSWCKSRIIIDDIPFRSSWEAYFYIYMKYVKEENIKFEQLRIEYFSSVMNADRIYI